MKLSSSSQAVFVVDSLGGWLLREALPTLFGAVGEVILGRGQRIRVTLGEGTLIEGDRGALFVVTVVLQRYGARARMLEDTSRLVPLGCVPASAHREPLPDAERRAAVIAILRRWKEELARRLALIPPRDRADMTAEDLPLPESPVALALLTARHGAPGPRPRAGEVVLPATLRELDEQETTALALQDVVRVWRTGDFTIVLQSRGDVAAPEDVLSLQRDGGELLPIVLWYPVTRQAFSADGDEPAWRLFAEWMRAALWVTGLDRPLPLGPLPSEWVLLQDGAGEPIDHRIGEGAIARRPWSELQTDASRVAAAGLFRAFLREKIDPSA